MRVAFRYRQSLASPGVGPYSYTGQPFSLKTIFANIHSLLRWPAWIGRVQDLLLLRRDRVQRRLGVGLAGDRKVQLLALDLEKLVILRHIPEVLDILIRLGKRRVIRGRVLE